MAFDAFRKYLPVLCFLLLFPWSGAAEDGHSAMPGRTEEPAVRVGFFPMPGFHEYDKAGMPAGYDVDYLRRLSAYTGWSYRFVRLETWDDALDALAEGRIDLVGSAQMNPQRAERFEYSAYSNGVTHAAIITLSGNADMPYEGFDFFDNRRFGCVETYIRKDEFARFAEKKGFVPRMAWYSSTERMRKALHAKEIDAMVCSVMELGADEKVVAEFAPAPFYYITAKGRTDLMDRLNAAISRMKIDFPTFETKLMDTHYPVSRKPAFSLSELAYVRENPVLRVGQFTMRSPLSSLDVRTGEGEVTGIIPDILELIGRDCGFSIVTVPMPSGTAPLDLLRDGRADAVAGVVRFPEQERDPSIRLTESLLSGRMILLAPRGKPFIPASPLKVAVPLGFKAAIDFVKTTYPHFAVVEYPTTRGCLEAVQRGEADVLIQTAAILDKFLPGPRYDNLTVVPTVLAPEKTVIALAADADPRLLSLLNKSIRRLSGATVDQIVINHTVARPYAITLEDFLFQYRNELLAAAALLALCGALLVYSLRQRRKNIELIRENEETLRNITNNINGGVITIVADQGFTITYANNGFLGLVGYTRQEYEAESLRECVTYVHPDDIKVMNEAVAGKQGGTVALELRIRRKTGEYVPVMFRGTLAKDKNGRTILFCVVMDITEQRALIESLTVEKERYELVVEQSNDIIFEVDLHQGSLMCSPKFQEKFGWQMDGAHINEQSPYPLRVHPEDTGILQQMAAAILHKERSVLRQVRIRKADGEYLWCRFLVSSIRHGDKLIKLIGKIEDVDDMVRERLRLEEMSRTDALSGLLNKMALRMSVEHSLRREKGSAVGSTLFFIDIDNFKSVNDNLGHPAGDQALRDVASVLRALFRSDDIIGRYGGDEFCVFARGMSPELVAEKASEINARLRRTYRDENGKSVDISASVGIARTPDDGLTYGELIEKADRAVYAAKAGGKNRFILSGDIAGTEEAIRA